MPSTTTRLQLPYPAAGDPADVPADIQALATKLDGATNPVGVVMQGAGSARPAAGVAGRIYYATDTGWISYDDGTYWRPPGLEVVSALPQSPRDGAEVFYRPAGTGSTEGVVWRMRYMAAVGGVWWNLGGVPMRIAAQGSATPDANGMIGPTLTTPSSGMYVIEYGAEAWTAAAAVSAFTWTLGVAVTGQGLDNANYGGANGVAGSMSFTFRRGFPQAVVAATLAMFLTGASTGIAPQGWAKRYLEVRPLYLNPT